MDTVLINSNGLCFSVYCSCLIIHKNSYSYRRVTNNKFDLLTFFLLLFNQILNDSHCFCVCSIFNYSVFCERNFFKAANLCIVHSNSYRSLKEALLLYCEYRKTILLRNLMFSTQNEIILCGFREKFYYRVFRAI